MKHVHESPINSTIASSCNCTVIDDDGYRWEFANYGEGLEPLGYHDRQNPNYDALEFASKQEGIQVHPDFVRK